MLNERGRQQIVGSFFGSNKRDLEKWRNIFTQIFVPFVSVDASEAGEGQVMIDSDLPVITYDKLQNRKYQVLWEPRADFLWEHGRPLW